MDPRSQNYMQTICTSTIARLVNKNSEKLGIIKWTDQTNGSLLDRLIEPQLKVLLAYIYIFAPQVRLLLFA